MASYPIQGDRGAWCWASSSTRISCCRRAGRPGWSMPCWSAVWRWRRATPQPPQNLATLAPGEFEPVHARGGGVLHLRGGKPALLRRPPAAGFAKPGGGGGSAGDRHRRHAAAHVVDLGGQPGGDRAGGLGAGRPAGAPPQPPAGGAGAGSQPPQPGRAELPGARWIPGSSRWRRSARRWRAPAATCSRPWATCKPRKTGSERLLESIVEGIMTLDESG